MRTNLTNITFSRVNWEMAGKIGVAAMTTHPSPRWRPHCGCRLCRRCACERRRPSRPRSLACIAPLWVTRGTDDAVGIGWQYLNSSTAQQQRRHSRGAPGRSGVEAATAAQNATAGSQSERVRPREQQQSAGTAAVIQKTRKISNFHNSAQSGPAADGTLAASEQ